MTYINLISSPIVAFKYRLADTYDEECGTACLGHASPEETIACSRCNHTDTRRNAIILDDSPLVELRNDADLAEVDLDDVMSVSEASIKDIEQSVRSMFASDGMKANTTTFDVHVPSGTLGLILDNCERSGAPIVHKIQDTSCLKDGLQEGDRLLSVDGIDVQNMDAIFVSKLISRSSQQPFRTLTFSRSW